MNNTLELFARILVVISIFMLGMSMHSKYRIESKIQMLDEEFIKAQESIKQAEEVRDEYRAMIKRLKLNGCR